jgi:hypothetical protein
MDNDLASGKAKMMRACFVFVGGVLTGGFLLLAVASSAQADLHQHSGIASVQLR